MEIALRSLHLCFSVDSNEKTTTRMVGKDDTLNKPMMGHHDPYEYDVLVLWYDNKLRRLRLAADRST